MVILTIVYISKSTTTVKDTSDLSVIAEVELNNREVSTTSNTTNKNLFSYIKIINSCNYEFVGGCVNLRSGPGTDYPVVEQVRNEVILKVYKKVSVDNRDWYKITFDEWLRYPERVEKDLYVSSDFVEPFLDEGTKNESIGVTSSSSKYIIIDLSDQTLYAYDNNDLFMEAKVSTGIKETPTPRGTFTIYKKTPSRYMQGPIPDISDKEYDLPGVPWNLYFSGDGVVIHGAYWHNDFGKTHSNGCVNLKPKDAENLYKMGRTWYESFS